MSGPSAPRRVLVVGGAGVFGRRLAEGLCRKGGFKVIIAGRDRAKADALAADLRARYPGVVIETAALDARSVSPEELRALRPWLVVDAAGPFQGSDARLARAAIAAGCHYVDLADARDFVLRFDALDASAREAGTMARSGASSTPALSNAVLDSITSGWRRIDSILVAISPGNRAPRGLSVLRAILSYSGRPVAVFTEGAWTERPGWGMLRRVEFPGLGGRWASLVDTPDLSILPERFRPTREAIFLAGLELPVLHLGLWALSLAVRWRWVRSLEPFARPLLRVAGLPRPFGTDRGGMVVSAEGIDGEGCHRTTTWSLVAEEGDGPNIPVLPALAFIGDCARGTAPKPGAGACVGILTLERIEAEMRPFAIATALRSIVHAGPSLFERALGGALDDAPLAVASLHRPRGVTLFRGEADITGASNRIGRAAAALFRFPKEGRAVPLEVEIAPDGEGEAWSRTYAGRTMRSRLTPAGRDAVCERFGPFAFRLLLAVEGGRLTMTPDAAWAFGVKLPAFCVPWGEGVESVDADGRFRFDVTIALPLLGRLVHYRGWLRPVEAEREPGRIDAPHRDRAGAG